MRVCGAGQGRNAFKASEMTKQESPLIGGTRGNANAILPNDAVITSRFHVFLKKIKSNFQFNETAFAICFIRTTTRQTDIHNCTNAIGHALLLESECGKKAKVNLAPLSG